MTGATPAAVLTAARIAPPPGIGPSGVGYVASSFVPISRAPLRARRGRDAHPLVVELAMETDHHDVDVDAGGIVACHGHRADRLHGLGHARAAADEDTLAPTQQGRGGDRRRHHVALGRDADRRQRRFLVGQSHAGVVRDEHDPPPAAAQASHGLDGPGNRDVGQPDHPVEVQQHGTSGSRAGKARSVGRARNVRCLASCRSGPSAMPRRSTSTR